MSSEANAQAQQLFELVTAALQSHERLESVEKEFEQRLKDYWSEVQRNVDHGVLLAKLDWGKKAEVFARTNASLERENARLERKLRLAQARLTRERAKAQRAETRPRKKGRR